MGLFKTSVNYNPEKVQSSIEEINNIKNNLYEVKDNLYSALSTIKGANGFDLVEAEGVNVDIGIADSLTSECISSIETIVNSINEKTMQIQAYNDASGLSKYWIFANIKFKDVRTELDKKINDLLTTGAAATGSFESEADKILKTSKKKTSILDHFKSLASDTGAIICKGASKIFDVIGSAVGNVKDWFKSKFSSTSKKDSNDEKAKEVFNSKNTKKEGTTPSTTKTPSQSKQESSPILQSIRSKLSNTNTDNKSISLDNLSADSRVTKAIDKYSDEILNADYATVSDNILTTTTTENINGAPVQVTHVVINDPSQINGAPANNGYGNGLETVSSASKRVNSVIAVNGSHFNYGDGTQDLKGGNHLAIVNGEVKTNGSSGGQELLIDKSGNIFNSYGSSAQDLVDSGVKYSYSCHSTQVIENGDTSPSYNEPRAYKRTVVGMTEPCEYYITTDQTYNNTLSGTAEYLKSKGCTNAFSLDQGGSVTLTRGEKVINQLSDEGERAVGDILYFTE